MRRSSLSLVGVLAIVLTGAPTLVAAQPAETQPGAAVGVIVTATDFASVTDGVMSSGEGWVRLDGMVHTSTWEATDPRLSGEATIYRNVQRYRVPETHLQSHVLTLVNDEGDWTGTGHSIGGLGGRYGDSGYALMTGAGAYEGLHAYLSWSDEGTLRGLITAEGMPSMPISQLPDE